MTSVSTVAATIAFSGTASGASLTAVTWNTSNGDSGTASGLSNWTVPAIPLLVGVNTVTINANNGAVNTAWRSVVVTRR